MIADFFTPLDSEGDGFTPLGLVSEAVTEIARDKARSGYRVFGDAHGFEVAIPEDVVRRMLTFGRHAAPSEWYGPVIGRVCEDVLGRHVVVLGILPDEDADAGPGHVQTSHASEFRARSLARLLFPDGVILGWAHGHVHCGVRFSPTDRENQATWTQPHAIGIVVDPWSYPELAVYRGPEAELLRLVEDDRREPSEQPSRPATLLARRWGVCDVSSPLASSPPVGQYPPERERPHAKAWIRRDAIAWAAFFALTLAATAVLGTISFFRTRNHDVRFDSYEARLHTLERTQAQADASAIAMSLDAGVEAALITGTTAPNDAGTDATAIASESSAVDAGTDAPAPKTARKARPAAKKTRP